MSAQRTGYSPPQAFLARVFAAGADYTAAAAAHLANPAANPPAIDLAALGVLTAYDVAVSPGLAAPRFATWRVDYTAVFAAGMSTPALIVNMGSTGTDTALWQLGSVSPGFAVPAIDDGYILTAAPGDLSIGVDPGVALTTLTAGAIMIALYVETFRAL